MKIVRVFLAVALATFLLSISSKATKAQKFSYLSGVQIQNLSGTPANITLTFFNSSTGAVEGSPASDTISANSSKTYFGATMPVIGSGFNGSLVISSDQPVASVSNILGNTSVASASYVGVSSGSTSLLIPLLMKGNNGNDTWFSLQNTGTSDANVSISYSDGTSASGTIKPGAAKQFFQASETHSVKVFAATITGNQPLAATVIQETSSIMYAYSAFNGGSTNPVMPLINANNGNPPTVTGVQIQNAGTQATTVTLSYTPSLAGTACTETQTINPGQSNTYALAAFANGANSTCAAGARFVGTAKVTANSANQLLVAVVNQLNFTNAYAEAYGAFDPGTATSTVVMPLILDRTGKDSSGFSVMNVGTGATTITCSFSNSAYTETQSLQPGEAATKLQGGKLGGNYVGSSTCTADASGKIVGIVNQLGVGAGDQFKVYEGINN